MHKPPIDLVPGLTIGLWEAIEKWAAIPADEGTLEARVAAAADVERVVTDAVKLRSLINSRMALDRLAWRLRDGGPETPREELRQHISRVAEWINEIVPRSPLR